MCGRWNDPLALGEALDISQSGGRAIWYPSVDLLTLFFLKAPILYLRVGAAVGFQLFFSSSSAQMGPSIIMTSYCLPLVIIFRVEPFES